MSEFDEYIVHEEPGQRDKASAWQMAIGLQDVDGLKPSKFLLQQVKANIEGKISKSRTLHIRWNEPLRQRVDSEEAKRQNDVLETSLSFTHSANEFVITIPRKNRQATDQAA